MGVCLDYTVISLLLLSLVYDLYTYFSCTPRGAYYLVLLKVKELSLKKRTKLQELLGGILLTFYVGSRGFLSNPAFRIAQAQALRVVSLGWLAIFLQNIGESLAGIGVLVIKKNLPSSYQRFRQDTISSIEDFCYDISLYHNTSYVIAWLLSLVVFLVFTGKFFLLANTDLCPSVAGVLKVLALHSILFFILEATKAQIANHMISLEAFLARDLAIGLYASFQPIWALVVYYRLFKYCWTRAGGASVDAFRLMLKLPTKKKASPLMGGVAVSLKLGSMAVIIMVFSSLYLFLRVLFL